MSSDVIGAGGAASQPPAAAGTDDGASPAVGRPGTQITSSETGHVPTRRLAPGFVSHQYRLQYRRRGPAGDVKFRAMRQGVLSRVNCLHISLHPPVETIIYTQSQTRQQSVLGTPTRRSVITRVCINTVAALEQPSAPAASVLLACVTAGVSAASSVAPLSRCSVAAGAVFSRRLAC